MSTTLEYTADLLGQIADSSRDRQKWLVRGRELAQADATRQFEIGDWLIEGEDMLWSRLAYDKATDIFTGYTRASLHTIASVARSVKPLSRNKDLSWAHHKAVARFRVPELQEQLLAHAAEKGLSVAAFRKHIDERYPTAKLSAKPDSPAKLVLVVPPDMLGELERVALAMGEEVENAALFLMERALQSPDLWERLENVAEKAS